jgi:hypothetical protein
MFRRISILGLLLALLLIPQADAKNKKKQVLPDDVLKAERVYVMIRSDAGEPLTNPSANRTARENVERALMNWGRFRLVMNPQLADLIFMVRKGHASGPTIVHSPTDDPPVVIGQAGGPIRIGGRAGPPNISNTGPGISNEMGPAEDLLEVYRGGNEIPLAPAAADGTDTSLGPPVWRFAGKDALKEPQVRAVEEFKKALTESEKAHNKKP